jgi:predicted Rossmann-fold nucleotide-binding protein
MQRWAWAARSYPGESAPLRSFLDRLVMTGFVRPEHRAMLPEAVSPEELLTRFLAYQPPEIPKWISPAET